MTDKEQVIIHGVDVSKCICCLRICTTTKKPEAICNEYAYCSQTPNCYYKQLARKTQELYLAQNEVHFKTEYIQEQRDIIKKLEQECEELKEELHLYKTFYRAKHGDVKNTLGRYRNALEEIKKYCIDQNLKYDYTAFEILNIINKAKGEGK